MSEANDRQGSEAVTSLLNLLIREFAMLHGGDSWSDWRLSCSHASPIESPDS